jgi:HEAT repeat protein
MDDLRAFADNYIGRLERGGHDWEDAYFRLIEASDAIIPILIERYHATSSADLRALLVEIIWQHRQPETIEFLAKTLDDTSESVRQNALDGLVTLGGPPALLALETARQRLQISRPADKVRAQWFDEAIEHVREQLGVDGGPENTVQ